MKRSNSLLSIIVCIILLLSPFSTVGAETAEALVDGKYTYTVTNGEATIICYDDYYQSCYMLKEGECYETDIVPDGYSVGWDVIPDASTIMGYRYEVYLFAQYFVKVGNNYYSSIDDALSEEDYSEANTIQLLTDIDECVVVMTYGLSGANIIIDLNGHTWSCTNDPILEMDYDPNITIMDSREGGKLVVDGDTISDAAIIVWSGSFTLLGGTIENNIHDYAISINYGGIVTWKGRKMTT